MANNKLTPKQEAFILAYLETGNASEAYRRAYNASGMNAATINREAHSLLEHPKVAPRIRELQNHVTNRAVEQVALSRAWVLDRLMPHAQVCLSEPTCIQRRMPVCCHGRSMSGRSRNAGFAHSFLSAGAPEAYATRVGEFANLSTARTYM